jgi:hypothetical protein
VSIFQRLHSVWTRILFLGILFFFLTAGGCGGGANTNNKSVSTIVVDGSDYSIDGNVVNINGGGEYIIAGALRDGCVVVDSPGEEVRVVLSGVTISNSNGPAILIQAASTAAVILSGGTVNVLSDGGVNEEHDGAIFSFVPLVIDGDGALTVIGNNQEGIASDSTLTIEGGNIRVTAADDGINAGEGIVINGGYIYVDSVGDGIDSNANLTINGGTVISLGGMAGGDGGLDAEEGYGLFLNGGLIIATGFNNARPDASEQKYILLSFGENQALGTTVHIEESSGSEVVTFKPGKEYREFLFSSGALKNGGVYNVYSGGESSGSENDGLYQGGTYSGGSKLAHFNNGSAEENFVISESGGVFNLREGQPNQEFPGGPQPPANGDLPPGFPEAPRLPTSGDRPLN